MPDNEHGLTTASFHTVALSVLDLDASVRWYGQVLGFAEEGRTAFPAVNAQVAFLTRAGLRLELLQVEGAERVEQVVADPPRHLLATGYKAIVFEVDDLAAATAELDAMSASVVWRNLMLTDQGMPSTLIRDIDGNYINILQRPELELPRKLVG